MNEMFQKLVKAVQLRDTTDECAIVRIVLETLWEPTEEMLDNLGDDGYNTETIKRRYQQMIDEILKW